jgi:hypothetical protein
LRRGRRGFNRHPAMAKVTDFRFKNKMLGPKVEKANLHVFKDSLPVFNRN